MTGTLRADWCYKFSELVKLEQDAIELSNEDKAKFLTPLLELPFRHDAMINSLVEVVIRRLAASHDEHLSEAQQDVMSFAFDTKA